ncbi:unnamed protein product, partial [Clonostachys rosea f. rosea IK726]
MIEDEVQTGFVATAGSYFGDRMLVPDKAYRQFNAWIGDPARVIMGKAVIQENPSKNLVEQCSRVGDAELEKLSRKYRNTTYIAFAALVKAMKMEALNIGTCGVNTVVRLRPILIFEEQH